jgi:rhodanese-related sulfurtransferase
MEVKMPAPIDRHRLRELMTTGIQLVEVLPREEYDEEHLAGAMNIPLKQLDAHAVAVLDPTKPVVVYCWDAL